MKRVHDTDGGFTLAELLVAMVLLAVVLGISFMAMQVVYKGRQVSDRQAGFAQEVAQPLAMLEKTSSQAITIIMPDAADFPYKVSLLTDRDNDDTLERNDIQAWPDGRLTQEVWLTNSQLAYTTLVFRYTLSVRNANRARGIPLFTYRTDEPSATVIATMADVPSGAKNLVVTVATVIDGELLQDSRSIYLRNR